MTQPSPTSGWVRRHLGVELHLHPPVRAAADLGVAIRRNPRRVQLLVNPSLAKHVPVAPEQARRAAAALAEVVRATGQVDRRTLVMGFAETATGLSQLVAEALAPVDFITTTRTAAAGTPGSGHLAFEEEHSHAVRHLLVPVDQSLLVDRDLIVLVDDELSTGRTTVNVMRQLRSLSPKASFIVACLVDARPEEAVREFTAATCASGIEARVLGLDRADVGVPLDASQRAAPFLSAVSGESRTAPTAPVTTCTVSTPTVLPRGGLVLPCVETERVVSAMVAAVGELCADGSRIHVVGDEEQIYLAVRLAEGLQVDPRAAGWSVVVSSTTRSPILAIDRPDYPVRSVLEYQAAGEPRYLYNVGEDIDVIVLVPDVGSTRLDDLASLLRVLPARQVIAVRWT